MCIFRIWSSFFLIQPLWVMIARFMRINACALWVAHRISMLCQQPQRTPNNIISRIRAFWLPSMTRLDGGFFDFFLVCSTQLARQIQQERNTGGHSNKVSRKRLTRRHSCNAPWTHEFCFEVNIFVWWDCIQNVECCFKAMYLYVDNGLRNWNSYYN